MLIYVMQTDLHMNQVSFWFVKTISTLLKSKRSPWRIPRTPIVLLLVIVYLCHKLGSIQIAKNLI